MSTKRHLLALDLKDDPKVIEEYDRYHREVWPEVLASLHAAGIANMEIYRTGNRLVMIIDVNDSFSFEKKAAADLANAKVQEWETLMSNFQQTLPWTKPGEKWLKMERVFELT
ncbi:MAG: L-rhamnose mutarotase [Flavitalea sp.]